MYVWIALCYVESSNDSTTKQSKNYPDKISSIPTLNPIRERFQKGVFWDPIRKSISTTTKLFFILRWIPLLAIIIFYVLRL